VCQSFLKQLGALAFNLELTFELPTRSAQAGVLLSKPLHLIHSDSAIGHQVVPAVFGAKHEDDTDHEQTDRYDLSDESVRHIEKRDAADREDARDEGTGYIDLPIHEALGVGFRSLPAGCFSVQPSGSCRSIPVELDRRLPLSGQVLEGVSVEQHSWKSRRW
jgi:hypothetical protein